MEHRTLAACAGARESNCDAASAERATRAGLTAAPIAGSLPGIAYKGRAAAPFHRIDHSRLPERRDRNAARALPIRDSLFGTCRAPLAGRFPPTGADRPKADASPVDATGQPFRVQAGTGAGKPGLAPPRLLR